MSPKYLFFVLYYCFILVLRNLIVLDFFFFFHFVLVLAISLTKSSDMLNEMLTCHV